jgi:hypothetical protein
MTKQQQIKELKRKMKMCEKQHLMDEYHEYLWELNFIIKNRR